MQVKAAETIETQDAFEIGVGVSTLPDRRRDLRWTAFGR
jgi:hypothetical protein